VRTILSIDDDVLAFARALAQRENIPIGEAMSKLVREGIRAQSVPTAQTSKPKSKYALLPASREIITTQHVRKLMDREDILDADKQNVAAIVAKPATKAQRM
jgi:hypothetical protein